MFTNDVMTIIVTPPLPNEMVKLADYVDFRSSLDTCSLSVLRDINFVFMYFICDAKYTLYYFTRVMFVLSIYHKYQSAILKQQAERNAKQMSHMLSILYNILKQKYR